MQLAIPYYRPYKRPLNYPKYKKTSNPYAHVQIFKATIKVNNETMDEKISNLFNFTLMHHISVTIT
jgi:hypothetical protein